MFSLFFIYLHLYGSVILRDKMTVIHKMIPAWADGERLNLLKNLDKSGNSCEKFEKGKGCWSTLKGTVWNESQWSISKMMVIVENCMKKWEGRALEANLSVWKCQSRWECLQKVGNRYPPHPRDFCTLGSTETLSYMLPRHETELQTTFSVKWRPF